MLIKDIIDVTEIWEETTCRLWFMQPHIKNLTENIFRNFKPKLLHQIHKKHLCLFAYISKLISVTWFEKKKKR